MTREQIINRYKCSLSDACTIEKIVPVKEHNENCHPDNKCPFKYGYVIPIYHGYKWAKTKKELIRQYTFASV